MSLTERYVSVAGAGAHDGTSEANAWSLAESVTAVNALGAGGGAGLRLNVKADATHARTTATDTYTVGGSSTSPFVLRGYLTTPGDGYLGRTNGHCCGGELITTNMPAITYTTGRLTLPSWAMAECLNISGANLSSQFLSGADNHIQSCSATNSGTSTPVAIAANARTKIVDCDGTLSGASGGVTAFNLSNTSCLIVGSRGKGGTGSGCRLFNVGCVAVGCCFYGGVRGVEFTGTTSACALMWSTITANSGDGVNVITATTVLQHIFGNCITDNGGYGINGVSAANAIGSDYNRLRDNTSGNVNSATDWMAAISFGHVTTDTGGAETDYVASGSNDYRLINGSPAQNMVYGQAAGAYQFSPVAIPVGHGCMG